MEKLVGELLFAILYFYVTFWGMVYSGLSDGSMQFILGTPRFGMRKRFLIWIVGLFGLVGLIKLRVLIFEKEVALSFETYAVQTGLLLIALLMALSFMIPAQRNSRNKKK